MTTRSKIAFDFEEAVEMSWIEHPVTQAYTFLHVKKPDNRDIRVKSLFNAPLPDVLKKAIEKDVKKTGSRARRHHDRFTGEWNAVILSENGGAIPNAVEMDRDMTRHFVFFHELAHVLAPNGFIGHWANDSYSESIADAYATIRLLQKFGTDADAFLQRWHWKRAADFANDPEVTGEYVTTPVIAQILEDAQDGRFARLIAPRETIRLAENYASRLTPLRIDVTIAQENLSRHRGLLNAFPYNFALHSLVKTLKATPHKLTFQLGATIFSPLLHPAGALIGGRHAELPYRWYDNQKLHGQFKQRAQDLGLDTLYQSMDHTRTEKMKPPTAKKILLPKPRC